MQADVRSLPFADRSFDVVIDFGTCYHIPHSGRAVAEIERVLAPGGRFVTETRASQALAHPIRTSGRGLPWSSAPRLERTLRAVPLVLSGQARVRVSRPAPADERDDRDRRRQQE